MAQVPQQNRYRSGNRQLDITVARQIRPRKQPPPGLSNGNHHLCSKNRRPRLLDFSAIDARRAT